MKKNIKILLYLIVISLIFTSCKESGSYQPVSTKNKLVINNKTHKVIAKAYEKAGTYSYVLVEENDKEFWIAIPKKDINIGDTYYYKGGMKMVDFKSKELNKVFKEVWFVDALFDKEPKVYKPVKSNENAKTVSLAEIIEQPENGISIENLLKNSESLSNREVVIRGKVVKVNRNILDRNWVHVKDGTTFNDKTQITITTTDSAGVGEVLVFKGIVALEKDFGYGYVYPVLVENGSVLRK